MYGRTSQRICNYDLSNQALYKTCANIEQSKHQTQLRCQKKSTCQILIDNTLYNDPCGLTIPKHFEIHYRCINYDDICFQLFLNCSKTKDLKCIKKIQDDYSCQCPSTICEYNSNNQLSGFIETRCLSEHFQGIHWPKTLVNKGQHMPCPYPCTGQIFRFCHMNSQWSSPNYTNCECPINNFDQSSMHRLAHSYIFQCNFWLINRLLPQDNQCIFGIDDNDNSSSTCLFRAFEKMSFTSCLSFSIDFKNLGFEIFIPMNNQNRFYLPTINSEKFGLNQIIVEKNENTYTKLPMMFIDTKSFSSSITSVILVEQSMNLTSIQTANVTVIFNHQSSELRYQCRAYRSTNLSFQFDSSDMFFACQLLCSNGSHTICQCPFYNPFMRYVLHLDTSIPQDDFELLMIDNDLKDKCLINHMNKSIEKSMYKINNYLNKFSSFTQKTNLAKKLISFIDNLIDNEDEWRNATWNMTIQLIQNVESIGLQLIDLSNPFISINNHIELFVNSQQFENTDRSIIILSDEKLNWTFFTISKLDKYLKKYQLNSHIVNLNMKQMPKKEIQIVFRHLNQLNISNQISTCVYLKHIPNSDSQWSTDGCYLLSSNITHSICSCNHLSTFAVLINFQEIIGKLSVNIHEYRLSIISKIGSVISIISLILTIITLIIRRRMDINDDLMIVRTILHINMSICLLIAQFLFLFGIDQIQNKFDCRTIIILFHYFLLATLSWMFVDGIELIIALKHDFKIDRIRILAYSIYAYGFPLLIVILSISLSSHGLDTSKYCWFSYENAFIWAFAIPFVLLIFANISFFIISIYTICKHRNTSNSYQGIRFSLRDISILSILFGLTWLIGLFHLQQQTLLIFSYGFTILNSFQGLFIFIFYCLLQKQIQHFYIHRISNIYKKTTTQEDKPTQHYNASSSGYSSAHSSELNKQILSLDHQTSFGTNTEYLSSMPNSLLSTFRYPTSNITLPPEHNEQLLKKYKHDLHHHDDHQYYEIS
ncbi:unnamed protein product [Adineta steineri]|uniref:Uncharacterized protein n=1 Tax=Adineta steineri TaxID=433720 RepID=A0A815YIP3_9BILA|nr:unnamed protein product [Adineta steineri]CAF1571458.1 unnamed protein product [Adineta steineri]